MGQTTKGACHCGTVQFTADVDMASARRCDCSICRMRGAVAVSAPLDSLTVTAGMDALTLYQFNTKEARHFFCSKCGIYTFHQRRSDPTQYGVNVACLEGVSPFDFTEVEVMNGQFHPRDGGGNRVSGVLRYTSTD
ncbi:GFA family protein [Croceicoccus mobilis]|uniref:CENP-V/GFA domain-containing protein n=1 Tax=Croceicoccus mobilis TaxID=1703339 RepID=A0A916Z4Z8_9SPHN|nr:GFA family protein [Croceicoccus mobilis]GGD76524.1 hypothetical protein GCM10010990_27770 [Croceicoccus mobilis]